MLGFPTPLNFVSVVGRFGDATSTVSMYRPANWQAKWDAIVSQPDYDKRMAQMKEMIKTIYDECIAIPYHFDGDRYALVGVNDLNHYAGRTVRWYDPANIWLSK